MEQERANISARSRGLDGGDDVVELFGTNKRKEKKGLRAEEKRTSWGREHSAVCDQTDSGLWTPSFHVYSSYILYGNSAYAVTYKQKISIDIYLKHTVHKYRCTLKRGKFVMPNVVLVHAGYSVSSRLGLTLYLWFHFYMEERQTDVSTLHAWRPSVARCRLHFVRAADRKWGVFCDGHVTFVWPSLASRPLVLTCCWTLACAATTLNC